MTLPISGTIRCSQIDIELGDSGTSTIGLGDADARALAGVPTGTIKMSDFYGKSAITNNFYTVSANTNKLSLTLSSVPGYVAGRTNTTITINSGIYVWSNDINVAALTISGAPGDTVTIVNNGFIMGKGGQGGGYDYDGTNVTVISATVGGPGINVNCPVTINTASGYVGGGGGGAPLGGIRVGGAGGGAGGGNGGWPGGGNTAGSLGGAIGQPGQAGNGGGGGGGGRIMPGTGGSSGSVANGVDGTVTGGGGGAGGGGGGGNSAAAPGKYVVGSLANGGGGGWGAVSGNSSSSDLEAPGHGITCGVGGAAGNAGSNGITYGSTNDITAGLAGGKAINSNGNSVTVTGGAARIYGIIG